MRLARACLALLALHGALGAAPPLPRIHVRQLSLPGFEEFARGGRPFVLTDAMRGWDGKAHFAPEVLAREHPDVIVDFYPQNLDKLEKKPFLLTMQDAMNRFLADNVTSYAMWRMSYDDTIQAFPHVTPLPYMLTNPWIPECLPTSEARNNLLLICAWHIVVVGKPGSGMFLHFDSLNTGTWQAQIFGRKEWMICDPRGREYLYEAGQIDAFNPDLKAFPRFRTALEKYCTREVANEGEILFYPSNWWHQTRNLDFPTVGLVGRIVTRYNYGAVRQALRDQCARPGPDISKRYKGAAPRPHPDMCGAVEKCYDLWDVHFRTLDEWYATDLAKRRSIPGWNDTGAILRSYDDPTVNGATETTETMTTETKETTSTEREESVLEAIARVVRDPLSHPDPLCRVAPLERMDCAAPTRTLCEAAGCCWSPTAANCSSVGTVNPGSDLCPWCFAPAG